MPLLQRLVSLGRNLFARQKVERDLDDELRSYLNLVVEEKRAAGMNESEARRAAFVQLGGVEQVKEQVRRARAGQIFQELLQDLRYGARALRRSPVFTAVAMLALAVGIGANTAMFSVAYGILLRPLPYPGADRVAVVYMRYYPRDFAFGTLCIRDYLMWKDNNHTFETPSLFRNQVMDVGGGERAPEQIQGASVTAGFFDTLEVRPLIGRTFAAGEDNPNSRPLVVLGESIWRRRFAASPQVLGQTILLNGASSTVIGVMPARFQFPRANTDLWSNLSLNPPTRYGPWFYRGVARLKPGVTMQQAQADLANLGLRMMQQNPDYQRLRLPTLSLRDALIGPTLKPAILILAGAVILVLLIAVVNVANLMLARATVREREMALRVSLGAGRGRLLRQLFAESVLLAMLGGLAGLAVAWGAVALIRAWNPGNLPFIESVRLDWGALGFMLLVSMLTGLLFGLVPALEAARSDLNSAVKGGGRVVSYARGRMKSSLVVSEIAISLTLLVGAGLLLRSFLKLQSVAAGFYTPPNQILTMLISPGSPKYREARAGLAFYEEVLRRARSIPGVQLAALTDSLPPDRQGDADTFGIEGQTLRPGELNPIISDVTANPGFFKALGIPLVRGRYFSEQDTASSEPVAIVSEGFVRRFLANRDPLRTRIRASGASIGATWLRIVGVIGNVKYLGLAVDTDPAYYLPFAQSYSPRMFLVVKTSGDAGRLAPALRREIQSVDPGITLAWIATMEQALQLSVSQPRFDTLLLALFAGTALLLAAVGIYGLIAYTVAQRTREIGVRMALGAAQTDVVGMVVRQGVSLAIVGIAIGLGGAFVATRLLKTMLFETGITDPVTFSLAPLGILAVVLLATLVPALRATRISPVVALRYE